MAIAIAGSADLRKTARCHARVIMSRYYHQMPNGDDEAKRLLRERLARKELGDAAWDKAKAFSGDRAFKWFGLVFILAFAIAILVVAWLGL